MGMKTMTPDIMIDIMVVKVIFAFRTINATMKTHSNIMNPICI